MLNKLSFNLMSELNESETKEFKIKKKVFMEGSRIRKEIVEGENSFKYSFTPDEIKKILLDNYHEGEGFESEAELEQYLDEELNNIKRIEAESDISMISQPGNDSFPGFKYGKVRTILRDGRIFISEENELPLISAVELSTSNLEESNLTEGQDTHSILSKVFAQYPDIDEKDEEYLNGLPYDELVIELKNRGWDDLLEEAAPVNSDLKTGKEDRLASLKMQLEKDGAQLADDEKAAIEDEIANLEKELQECDKPLTEENNQDFKVGDVVKVPYKYGSYTPGEFTEAPIIEIEDGKYVTVEVPSKQVVMMDQLKKWNTLDESAKSLKEGFKLGEKAEILDQTERRGQPVALVKLQKMGDEYVVAFGYTVENDEISWDYGYYYYDEASGKEAFEKVKAGGNLSESAKSLKEEYSEKLGGDPEDFVSDVETIKAALEAIDAESFGSHLAQQMVYDWIDTCNYQIEKGKRLASGNEFYSESEKIKKKPIVEAAQTEVKDLQIVKEQGNIYMLEDKSEGTRYIVGENYNLSEGEIENAEIYDNKEEADKDYLDRCEITTTKESDQPLEDTNKPVEESVIDDLKANHYMKKAAKEASKGDTKKSMKSMTKAYKITDKSIDKLNKKINKLNNKAENLKNKANDSTAKITKVYDDNFNAKK